MKLDNVVMAVPSLSTCLALCSSLNSKTLMIIENWSRKYSAPDDIISIIILHTKTSKVYSTTNVPGSGHPKDYQLPNKNGWNEVQFFNDKNVIKIVRGDTHTLFLEENGNVWGCGCAEDGGLGIGDLSSDYVYIPIEITYFRENGIFIKDIACGAEHSLAVSVDGNIYSWGNTGIGQCGHGKDNTYVSSYIYVPRLILALSQYKVEIIKCGYYHSYCKTVCGKYYLWGSNSDLECRLDDQRISAVYLPYRIDLVLKEKHNIKKIIDIYPGYYNTKIMVQFND